MAQSGCSERQKEAKKDDAHNSIIGRVTTGITLPITKKYKMLHIGTNTVEFMTYSKVISNTMQYELIIVIPRS